MRLYLIRHGQSTNNALVDGGGQQRVADAPLTELGTIQADLLANHIANADGQSDGKAFGITHIFCSPMLRALQTTQPLANALGIQPEIWVETHETGGVFLEQAEGEFVGYGGMTHPQIQEQFPGFGIPASINDQGWWQTEQGLERDVVSQFRAMKVAEAILQYATQEDHIAIVSHFAFINLLMRAFFRTLPSRRAEPRYFHQNTAITRMQFKGDEPIIFYQNRVEHLAAELRTW